jgi:hypothetical protein
MGSDSIDIRTLRRICWVLFLATVFATVGVGPLHAGVLERLFAPRAELWTFWVAHEPGSTSAIDHGDWDHFLGRYVTTGGDGINRVRYRAVTSKRAQALADYVAALQAVPVRRLNRREQLAYWINLYNAVTVKLVLEHYPVRSTRDIDISPGLFADGPWDKKLLAIEGEQLSLNDIEHRILRPIWQDPRIHYALNCASLGCPNLAAQAYSAATLEAELDGAAKAYVNHPRGARIEGGTLVVSSIYSWFRDDFGGSDTEVIAHLRRYAAPPLATTLESVSKIAGDEYDWALNDAEPRPR